MKEIIFAGFGGQGVLTSGLLIAYMSANKDLAAVWMPAYGPTMRGGKANCVIKIGEDPQDSVGSPVMENADAIVVMNEPSLDYLSFCKEDVVIFANATAIPKDYKFPEKSKVFFIDFLGLAREVDNEKGQNVVAAGAVIKYFNLFDEQYAIDTLCQFFTEKGKGKLNDLNVAALKKGFEAIQ